MSENVGGLIAVRRMGGITEQRWTGSLGSYCVVDFVPDPR